VFGLRSPALADEHTDSYYAARAPGATYPVLEGDLDADVVVVGGGFSGVNTALELAERGIDVVLLEARRIAWGASGRNGGQIIGGVGHDPERFRRDIGDAGVRMMHAIGVECVDIIRERISRYAIDCDLRWGFCEVALKQRHLRAMRATEQQERERGYPHPLRLLDRDELRQFVGSDAYLGGLYDAEGAGHLDPMRLCRGEAAAAAALGARLFELSPAVRLEHGERPRVITPGGSVSAASLVLCGNGYMDYLEPRAERLLVPASSCIICTEPLSATLAASVLPRDIAVCDMRTALDYFRLTADRRLLFGGLANYTGLVPDNYREVLQAKMLRVFPQLQGTAIDYAWDGQLAIGLNRMPQAGMLGPRSYFIQAYSGHGVAPSHVMARLVAEAVSGDSTRFDTVRAIRHWPFPGGRYLRRPVMALGMLYFKALDYL